MNFLFFMDTHDMKFEFVRSVRCAFFFSKRLFLHRSRHRTNPIHKSSHGEINAHDS